MRVNKKLKGCKEDWRKTKADYGSVDAAAGALVRDRFVPRTARCFIFIIIIFIFSTSSSSYTQTELRTTVYTRTRILTVCSTMSGGKFSLMCFALAFWSKDSVPPKKNEKQCLRFFFFFPIFCCYFHLVRRRRRRGYPHFFLSLSFRASERAIDWSRRCNADRSTDFSSQRRTTAPCSCFRFFCSAIYVHQQVFWVRRGAARVFQKYHRLLSSNNNNNENG